MYVTWYVTSRQEMVLLVVDDVDVVAVDVAVDVVVVVMRCVVMVLAVDTIATRSVTDISCVCLSGLRPFCLHIRMRASLVFSFLFALIHSMRAVFLFYSLLYLAISRLRACVVVRL